MSVRTPPAPSVARRLASIRLVRGLAIANLVAQIAIILTGGVVRLTGSGLGCSTWPQCEPGEFTPVLHEEMTYHPLVEFGNRTLTGVLGIIAIALVLSYVLSPLFATRPRSVFALTLAPILGIVTQAVIGGVTVLFHLHPGWVAVHYLVSAALVFVSTLLVVRLREGDGAPRPVLLPDGPSRTWLRLVPWLFAALTAAVVALGVVTTGAGPHSGDDAVGYRFALDPVLVARAHAGAVWLFIAALLVTLAVVARTGAPDGGLSSVRRARRAWWVLLVVTAAQGFIGYAQYFSGLPVPLVALHMLGSGILVAATTAAVLSLRVRESRAATTPR